ncbi:protein of unknown function [Candidatus Hydrogenisulfobacillus filiaventi]|uniref:Uncharacterized protein n=1 Tax=Candidatus Hydrogenisulfobacillus filiaventi TaxID=2707344 RepID=A0A6F8ZET2_9FIRM|nr:protein of unknown function [Candidatus Hydrogenisulfobacillus filiaventi]
MGMAIRMAMAPRTTLSTQLKKPRRVHPAFCGALPATLSSPFREVRLGRPLGTAGTALKGIREGKGCRSEPGKHRGRMPLGILQKVADGLHGRPTYSPYDH